MSRRGLIAGLLAAAAASVLAGCASLDPLRPPAEPPAGSTGPSGAGPARPEPARPPATPGAAPAPTPTIAAVAGPADSYLAVAPRVFRTGQVETVAVSLFRNRQPAAGQVQLELAPVPADGRPTARAAASIQGRGDVALDVGKLPAGSYQLRLAGGGFQDQAPVKVEDGTLLFLETDKPIYKPGQVVHLRLLTLDPKLRPVAGAATLDLADAKGNKVYRKELQTDEFGMAALDVPLSSEPNLGVWKATARAGQRLAQVDVRVERYVLPRYEVKVSLPKDWVLASEPLQGSVGAEYSYGKPVQGEVEVKALRYVGTWQEFGVVRRELDGSGASVEFRLPAVQYVSGVPGAGGLGNVRLEVTVREKATGYEEQTSRLLAVATSRTVLRLIPESLTFKPGLPLSLLVLAETPDKQPTDASVKLEAVYTRSDFSSQRSSQTVAVSRGRALVKLTPPADAVSITLAASDERAQASTSLALQAGYSPSGSFIHVEQASTGPLKVGDVARFQVSTTREAGTLYYEVVARGSVVFSDYTRSAGAAAPAVNQRPATIELALTPQMAPRARLLVYQVMPGSEVAADYVPFAVEGSYPQKVELGLSREEARPGEPVEVSVRTEGPARVGLAAVDRSVYILAENRLNLQQVFAELERLYQQPQVELHSLGATAGPPAAVQVLPAPVGRDAPVPVQREAPAPGAPARPGVAPVRPAPAPAVVVGGPLLGGKLVVRGAKEVFADAGVVVLTNQQVPESKEYQRPLPKGGPERALLAAPAGAPVPAAAPAAPRTAEARAESRDQAADEGSLAEVQRVRQLFPETWLWDTLTTDAAGRASRRAEAPDSITTWMLRAVALSKSGGLGVGEAQLRVLQPFFVQVDLPYAAVRGEEYPVRVALYNYQAQPEEFVVELEPADWLDLLGPASVRVRVGASDLGAASFQIRPKGLGVRKLKVTARSRSAADAIVKEQIVEPEGVQRELVENLVLSAGASREVALAVPPGIVAGSARALVTLTGSYLAQTLEGLEGLLKMPFGCGEQNMILFAPNVFVTRYLKETGQTKPEVLAKAEHLMTTGYQRQLTYRRGDGSFSAFGDSDREGSLWLSAFVLKTFAQAKDVVYVDDRVLAGARAWIGRHQRPDGSFEPVGFVHHQEMLGGLKGRTALTAFVAVALKEAGDDAAAAKAVRYLEGELDATAEAYPLALTAYALALTKSPRAGAAAAKLLTLARESDDGLSWGDEPQPVPLPAPGAQAPAQPRVAPQPPAPDGRRRGPSAAIETTGYALLAFLEQGDRLTASRAARWLVSRRNAYGGFGSTQDTVVGLQALTRFAALSRADVDASVALRVAGAGANWQREAQVTPQNADVLQVFEAPAGERLSVEVRGRGQVVLQVVRRFNVPDAEGRERSVFQVRVDYGAAQVQVDDLIDVTARVRYTPPEPIAAGMVVVDVAVPTGFAPETPTLEALVKGQARLKRFEVAGRKVIFYVEEMQPDEEVALAFKARALYPVRAQAVASQAYRYYRPEWKGESLGGAVVVGG